MAGRITRRAVAALPQTVLENIRKNESKLGMCCHDLSGEQQAEMVAVLNDDWSIERDIDESFIHWCPPGCCDSERTTKARFRRVLEASMARLFECPLLYRWKYFEPALAYCLRNMTVHGHFVHVWSACMTHSNDDQLLNEQVLEVDNPDLPPALKQQVRMGKVLRMLKQPGIVETGLNCRYQLS